MSWEGAVWQESSRTWSIRLSNVQTGENFTQECNILVSAAGGLVDPNPCDIPGAGTFKGPIVHTARWQTDLVLDDKDVIVIGNGSSGSQVIPAIAPKVKNLYQFIRSPQYYLPQRNSTIHPIVKVAFRYVPFLRMLARYLLFNFLEYTFLSFYTDKRGDRHRLGAKKWSDQYVEETAPKEYWSMLKPSYKVGCKRRVFDPGYLESLHRENVHLTDDPIAEIEKTGVVTKAGKHYSADVIVSSFDAWKDLRAQALIDPCNWLPDFSIQPRHCWTRRLKA